MQIGSLSVGAGQPCALIAEISGNHNGKFENAIKLLDAAKAAGASAGKLQVYTPNELVALRGDNLAPEPWGSQGWTMRTLYEKARTPLAWVPALFSHAVTIGLPLYASVFGYDGLAVLESVGNPCYKIAALDNHHEWLYDACRKMRKPILVSVRGEYEVPWTDAEHRLFCPAGYPVERLKLPVFTRAFLGVSLHSKDEYAAQAAVARGASLVEVHFHLEHEPSALEANVSWDEGELASMIYRIRRTEALLA